MRLASLFVLSLLLSGCWAHAASVVTWTVIPSIVAGAEMRAARASAENVGP